MSTLFLLNHLHILTNEKSLQIIDFAGFYSKLKWF